MYKRRLIKGGPKNWEKRGVGTIGGADTGVNRVWDTFVLGRETLVKRGVHMARGLFGPENPPIVVAGGLFIAGTLSNSFGVASTGHYQALFGTLWFWPQFDEVPSKGAISAGSAHKLKIGGRKCGAACLMSENLVSLGGRPHREVGIEPAKGFLENPLANWKFVWPKICELPLRGALWKRVLSGPRSRSLGCFGWLGPTQICGNHWPKELDWAELLVVDFGIPPKWLGAYMGPHKVFWGPGWPR